MDYNDLKRYNGYLPLRVEHQLIFDLLDDLVPGYTDNLFKAKWTGLYNIKVFKGERQVARLREKQRGEYRYIPLSVWLNLSDDRVDYTAATWDWINQQRRTYSRVSAGSSVVKARDLNNDPLAL